MKLACTSSRKAVVGQSQMVVESAAFSPHPWDKVQERRFQSPARLYNQDRSLKLYRVDVPARDEVPTLVD
jgi:hypothetical protein